MSRSCWKWTWQLAALLVANFIVFGLPWVIYYQVIKLRDPTVTIDYASVRGFNLTSDGHLTAFFDIGLRTENRKNKFIKLKYQDILVSVEKDGQNIGTDDSYFPGFTQRKGNVTLLRVQPVSANVTLKQRPAFNFGVDIGMGYFTFDVIMTGKVNLKGLIVECRGVMVNVTAPSTYNMTQNPPNYKGCSVVIYILRTFL